MSEYLRERLQLKLNLKILDEILSTCNSLEFIKYLETSEAPLVNSVWARIIKYDIEPFVKIPVSLSVKNINLQLQKVLQEQEISNEIYLSIGDLANLPWVKVKIIGEDRWLIDLWNCDRPKNSSKVARELIILNSQKDKAIGLLEEEYFYEIHIIDLTKTPCF